MQNEKLGIDNLKSLGVSAVRATQTITETLKDGFQITDLFAVVGTVGDIQNVGAKATQAWEEIKDLSPAEIEELEQYIGQEADLPTDGLIGKVRTALRLVARAYRLILDGQDIFEDARAIFA